MYRCYIKITSLALHLIETTKPSTPHQETPFRNFFKPFNHLPKHIPPKVKLEPLERKNPQAPLHLISPNPSLEKNSLPPYVNPRNNSLKGGGKPNSYLLNTFLERERN